ncbi:MAG: hypothetical protein JRJ71_14625, partial [Deltaproteobacteria bacterium]|nr:hypothetical protein [Deltaproteobacteria bacterium]
PGELTPEKVRGLSRKPFDWSRLMFLKEVLSTARENGKAQDPLFTALEEVIEENGVKKESRS